MMKSLRLLQFSRDKMKQSTFNIRQLGRVNYADGLEIQKDTALAVRQGTASDTLLLLEHPHTFTLGRAAKHTGILATEEMMRERGVSIYETNRGGKVTYHGIGQIVGYPIINLSPDREDVHRYMRDIEEVLIRTMSDFDIEAFRIKGLTGVHTTYGKVAAIGIHIARWITTHGFALNVNTDLSFFNMIIACEGEPVTSMSRILGRELELAEVEERIIARFAEVFEMEREERSAQRLEFSL
jgi:lipoyl(octanoyl) transferase